MVFLPIFVLFTRSRFGIEGALQLASLTYFFVVLLEVPSGWMSDRVGRVPTLATAAAGWIIAHSLFLFAGDRFIMVALGQFFLSAGFAFISGTDVSFHYDTLEALGRADEYAERQARVSSIAYLAMSVSAVTGGLLGLGDLRWAFAASLVLAIAQLGAVLRLHEPDVLTKADPFVSQLGRCVRYLNNRFMAWLFFYGIALVTLEHVAFTLMQPWLTTLLNKEPGELGATPLLSGVLFAVVGAVGSISARNSARAGERFGTVRTLIALAGVSAVIVTGMALTFATAALVLVGLRSVQGAAAPVLLSAAIAPRTEPQHRATLLSLNSLAGRLCYGTLLLAVSEDALDDPQPVLRILAVISWILVALLIVTSLGSGARAAD